MTEYKKPHFDGRYEVKNMKGEDVLPLLGDPFSVAPMRAVLLDGELGGRIDMLESIFNISLESGKKSLIVAVYAGTKLKEQLDPYEDRALAVTEALYDIGSNASSSLIDLGYIPTARYDNTSDADSWPGLLMAVYNLCDDGRLRVRVIPSNGFSDKENPLLPEVQVKKRGLVLTRREENLEKWSTLGYKVELIPWSEKP